MQEGALHGFSAEEQAALQWVVEKKEREPTKVFACRWLCCLFPCVDTFFSFLQLSLWMERWDEMGREMVENPDAEHVRVLWGMEKDKRVQVWERLGPFEEVTELELGGVWRGNCPVDQEELFMLLPEGQEALAGLRTLFLWFCGDQVGDGFLHALVFAGCGRNLTSLSLRCGCFFFSLFFLLEALFSFCVGLGTLRLVSPHRCRPFHARTISSSCFSLSICADLKEGSNETQTWDRA